MPSLESERLHLAVKAHDDAARRWAITDRGTGEALGEAWLLVCEEGFEVGWCVDEPRRGNGYATEAGRAVLQHAFDDLALDQVYAFIEEDARASQRVAEKLGMEHVRSEPGDEEVAPWREYAIARGGQRD